MKVFLLFSILAVYVYGANEPGGRIVNGSPAATGQFAFQVSVIGYTENMSQLCSGSLIATNFVLTSASCVLGINTFNLGFGSNYLSAPLITRTATSTHAISHADFNPTTLENDIAVIHLDNPVVLGATIQLINLPRVSQQSRTFTNIVGTVSGWGRISDASPNNSEQLLYIQVRVISNIMCSLYYPGNVFTSMLCTDSYEFYVQSICNGDFGSALTIQDGTSVIQIGVASFFSFYQGCDSGFPSGYTRVTSFLPWISNNTGILIEP